MSDNDASWFEKNIMNHGGRFALFVIVLTFAIAACCFGIAAPTTYYSAKYECEQAAVNADVETKFVKNYVLSWDCFVKVGDTWVPYDKWRGISE